MLNKYSDANYIQIDFESAHSLLSEEVPHHFPRSEGVGKFLAANYAIIGI